MGVCLEESLWGAIGSLSAVGIDKLSQLIKKSIDNARKPANSLPPFLTTIEGMCRPGMSAIALTSTIVSRLGEAGVDTGTLPDGSEPQITKFTRITCESMIKEIQLNSKTMIEIPTGTNVGQAGTVPVISTIPIQGTGITL